ncbi:hypothetical protein GGS21DRAFT_486148 [Xylaria nigripes]|nr:hypothetical protein GGS21DRAFT_486148 [Xylaria nigripes]
MNSFASDFKRPELPPRLGGGSQDTAKKSPFGDYDNDPRNSSTESLPPPPEYEEIERRKLLVIYVHGFMGNDTSFQSFPAHVHKYLKLALSDSHMVHSKIYPRYKTYKSIDIARDNFSKWLEPLESPKTDVVLVGHSMGGLLIADVALIPSATQHSNGYFKHRILGTVNLDSPLLGMHPGIVVSGISSLFRKNETPKVPGEPSAPPELSPGAGGLPSPDPSVSSVPSTVSGMSPSPPPPSPPVFLRPASTNDPNFNSNFPNDVRIKERTWWGNIMHFVNKHSAEGLIDAATSHIMSHMEFGGTMFDINSLKTRYESIRRLEDVDDLTQPSSSHTPPQVRFIQYYTICYGFPDKPKAQVPEQSEQKSTSVREEDLGSHPPQPHVPVDGPGIESQYEILESDIRPPSLSNSEKSSLELLSPEPMADEPPAAADHNSVGAENAPNEKPNNDHGNSSPTTTDMVAKDETLAADLTNAMADLELNLPAVPDLPPKPDAPDLEKYTDRDARRLVEKEAKRAQKAYAQAVKDRERAIRDRERIIEKRRKKLTQEAEKKAKEEKRKRQKEGSSATTTTTAAAAAASPTALKELEVSPPTSNQEHSEHVSTPSGETSHPQPAEWTPASPDPAMIAKEKSKDEEKTQKKKLRKFCNVPKSNGQVDPRWVSIFMKDMDEVAAHTSLFFAGEHYDRLVGEVGNTIVEWVQADMTKRTILGLGE